MERKGDLSFEIPFMSQPVGIAPELMNPLEERIGYKFRNSLLLAEALTHPSISLERKDYPFDNQRMEFLGDAVLQVIVTDHLYRMFPDFEEGRLTKLRSRLVSRNGLQVLAKKIGLGEFLMMGKGEEASGGRERASTLADAFEALVGAIYLDGGLEAAARFVMPHIREAIDATKLEARDENPKGYLQELLQSISLNAPTYEIISQSGPDHQKHFECRVMWEGIELGMGGGASKKQAEIAAAADALARERWKMQLPVS